MSYFSLYIFAFLLNISFTFAKFVPPPRTRHTSVLVDKKLYFFGGIDENYTALPWNKLTSTGVLQNYGASACNGGNNNDLFIFGGYESESFTIKYDINNKHWTNITSSGKEPINRFSFSCAKFNNRLITIFAGFPDDGADSINDLWIFDSFKLKWTLSNASNAPQTSILPLYDTASDTWKSLNTSGPTPPSRTDFSAVLTSDKRIIIFGGQNDFPSVFGDLWILDIATNKWSVGKISNPNGLTLYSHTATLVDNYMIVAFGSYGGNNITSTIYLLDVSKRDSYTWVTKFIPNTTNFK
ncbi:galactose oxidase [Gigaspora margarita]|uniref:Galactose oxidase n=1 Tax=Gigaspora margarita TaxID=4874 RepID=A0A8H3WSJ4_GIGMA|nr:galactose oxidase [Gigaspora margarita]